MEIIPPPTHVHLNEQGHRAYEKKVVCCMWFFGAVSYIIQNGMAPTPLFGNYTFLSSYSRPHGYVSH